MTFISQDWRAGGKKITVMPSSIILVRKKLVLSEVFILQASPALDSLPIPSLPSFTGINSEPGRAGEAQLPSPAKITAGSWQVLCSPAVLWFSAAEAVSIF